MPLPLIPALIAGGVAIATAVAGKKAYDAVKDKDEAEKVNKEAQSLYDNAKAELDKERKSTQERLEDLGRLKFDIYQNKIIPFQDMFSKITNLPKEVNLNGQTIKFPSKEELKKMEEINLTLKEIVGGGIATLGTGGLAGLAAYGGAATFGTASTGTAIATLSGVTATNATLAWLGGGALSIGGLGMAGGIAVLGGVVAIPVLAIGGLIFASKAEEAKENAYSNLEIAKVSASEMKLGKSRTTAIYRKAVEVRDILYKVSKTFDLDTLKNIVSTKGYDYEKYDEEAIDQLHYCFNSYETLSNFLETDLLTKDGELTKEIMALVTNYNKRA